MENQINTMNIFSNNEQRPRNNTFLFRSTAVSIGRTERFKIKAQLDIEQRQ